MKRHASHILGLPLVTANDGAHVGFVLDALFDPEKGKVLAYKATLGKVFSPMDVSAWHSNRVELADQEALVSVEDISRLHNFGLKRARLLNKKVVYKNGKKVGSVCDFTLESVTSSLLSIEVCKSFLLWQWDSRLFGWEDIQEITDSAVILNLDPELPLKSRAKDASSEKSSVRLSPVSTSSSTAKFF